MADTLEGAEQGPIILRKKVMLPEEAHGGAWKVAYADFVTAMMAFFLLLWLLNVTTEDKKQGISDFFEPIGVSEEQTGSGGVLKGLAMAAEGALRSAGSPPRITVPIPTFGSRDAGASEGRHKNPESTGGGYQHGEHQRQVEEENKKDFSKVISAINQAIQDIPELSQMQDSLVVEHTPDGLRIQLLDRVKLKMFKSNGPDISDRGKHLLAIIGSIVSKLPHQIAITGHTDLASQTAQAAKSKWQVSGDRADNARATLINFGVAAERFSRIVGKGDTAPVHPSFPKAMRNNRISVLLLNKPIGKAAALPGKTNVAADR